MCALHRHVLSDLWFFVDFPLLIPVEYRYGFNAMQMKVFVEYVSDLFVYIL